MKGNTQLSLAHPQSVSLGTRAYAARAAGLPLEPFAIQRRPVGPHDVLIDIKYCGVCHSDIHQSRDEWGGSSFPMVPGHEIVGTIKEVGEQVTRFAPDDVVGVGCMIDSCRKCPACLDKLEQYCEHGPNFAYNSTEKDGTTPTYGGYSERIVVDENYVLHIPGNLALNAAAPLLCAGITTFSPLKYWHAVPGVSVAVVGLGGLGHMAVKIASAMGAKVTVLSHSLEKRDDAFRFGAHDFVSTANSETFGNLAGSFDLIINTASARHDLNAYLDLLDLEGAMVLVGVPAEAPAIGAAHLIKNRRILTGSHIGGSAETQEMLNFCGAHNIVCDIEQIDIHDVNEAYERVLRGDVRYRFVIDCKSLTS